MTDGDGHLPLPAYLVPPFERVGDMDFIPAAAQQLGPHFAQTV